MNEGTLKKTAVVENIDLSIACEEAVRNILATEPKLRSLDLAERLVKESAPELLAALSHSLLVNHFRAAVQAERKRQADAQRNTAALLPGFEHLPMRITIAKGDVVQLSDVRYTDLKRYLKALNKRHQTRKETDAKILEVKGLMKLMARHVRKKKGITYAEVAAIEAKKGKG